MEPVQYTLIVRGDAEVLVKDVNNLLEEGGWQLHGGTQLIVEDGDYTYLQALVRYRYRKEAK